MTCEDLRLNIINLFPVVDAQSDEAIKRAYTNRCYYVIYHELKNILETKFKYDLSDKGNFGKMGSHIRVYEAINDLLSRDKNNINLRSLAMKFRDFLTKRHKADYDLLENFNEYDLKQIQGYYIEIPLLIAKIII